MINGPGRGINLDYDTNEQKFAAVRGSRDDVVRTCFCTGEDYA